ncbi:response regulator transcription factor [Lacrimispora saccharolytica]|uniref:Stage 0 sporulation protein A homolog n=1 Tax=Lacrimispora saccharolytica (strain ATCC 35040 / DSM 2544 / NRCC 2533 / WM1) TaxID=610130 RepID=D9R9X0_LACSW|nr:response regulator [Lacrimispora saccharolytica]ADL05942.1 response regulator receiver protein [[Clostridium] saccharolyticum WM1]QRV19925.1 response regulator [Lacrimispora saccharolytica]
MKKTIMIVDDSIVTRNEIEQLLKDTNFDVIYQCRSGEEALEAYEREKPDIVTMDIIMPGIDGIEASKRLLEHHPEAGIIIISSLVYDKTLQMVQKLGPSVPFVFKPIKKSYFIEALIKVSDAISKK